MAHVVQFILNVAEGAIDSPKSRALRATLESNGNNFTTNVVPEHEILALTRGVSRDCVVTVQVAADAANEVIRDVRDLVHYMDRTGEWRMG